MHGSAHVRAALRLTRINARFRSGRLSSAGKLQDALADLERTTKILEGLPADPERLEHTALAYQLQASMHFALGDLDAGLDAGSHAGDLFEQAGGKSENFGRFLHDFAVQLNEMTVPQLPLQYARRAAAVLAAYGEHYRRDLAAFVHALEDGTESVSPGRLEELRVAFASASGAEKAAAAQSLAIALLASEAAEERIDELHAALEVAFQTTFARRRRHGLESPLSAMQLMIELFWAGLPLPAWTPAALQALLEEVRRAKRLDVEPDVLTLQAVWLLSIGERRQGLAAAVSAVALHDEVATRSETSVVRMLTGRVNDYGRLFALSAAVDEGEAELVAELIESARLQVEPTAGAGLERAHGTSSRVGRLRRVSVGGRSALAGDRAGEPLALEDCIAAVGGPGAGWWGTWSANERIFWALWLRGRWSCGTLSVSAGETLTDVLSAAWQRSPLTPATPASEILTGPWCATAAGEEEFSHALGEALIPPELRAALTDAIFDDRPISLVLAGNLLALLPVALLGFATPEGTFKRILEAAIVRVAPPAVLIDRVCSSEQQAAELNPLHVACVDPRDDLVNSRQAPDGARIVLGGDRDDRDGAATLDALSTALAPLLPGQPGLLYYSGHAVSMGLGGDDQDALALAGNDMLSAHALFSGAAPLPMPARVLLSACSSAGATGAGGGEWLGLAAAVLWRGARQVIATNWPIWDTPFTADFDHQLARRLQRTGDPAAALRELQLVALAEWRASDHDLSDYVEDGLPYSVRELPFPLIWAAYTCVGVCR